MTIVAACSVLVVGTGTMVRSDAMSAVASGIVTKCVGSGPDHAVCYESEVPALYPQFSVPQLFDIIRSIRLGDPSYQFCHVLAHKVGERVVAEDPSAWIDAIPLNPPDGLCSNGFIHGVVGGRFRAEVLDDATIEAFLEDFKAACEPREEWRPSDLDRAICYHGLGHLYDFITNADIPKALSLCERTAPSDFRRVCVQGVFMQIYQPLEPDDYLLIEQMPVKPTKETVQQYCATFKEPLYVGSCLSESWPYAREELLDGTGVQSFCAGQPSERETEQCYITAASIVGRMSLSNAEQITRACSGFPIAERATCYTYSAQAVLEENLNDASKAVAVCLSAGGTTADQCIETLVDHALFTFGGRTTVHAEFCSSVPAKFRDRCFDTNALLPRK